MVAAAARKRSRKQTRTQGSSPTPLSRQRAHLEWESNPAIAWPQEPRLCPGEDIVVDNTVVLLKS